MGLKSWWARRKEEREARRLIEALFESPALLRGTSLKSRHGMRWILLRQESERGKVVRVWFGILRHPRPYPFSRQSHKVIEHYLYNVVESRVERLLGFNLTREKGLDADD
jgi:hypothetical protein